MNIAQIAPLYEAVPPRLYGGTERVVAHLCDALVELGHEVTLFAAADARTKARLVPVRDQAIRLDAAVLRSDLAAHLVMLHEVKRRSAQFDVLHFHVDMVHFPMFEQQAHKTVTTLHGRLDERSFDLLAMSYETSPNEAWIAIRRVIVALPLAEIAPTHLRQKIIDEFQQLVENGFTDDAARAYSTASQPVRSLILLRIQSINEPRLRAFTEALRKYR